MASRLGTISSKGDLPSASNSTSAAPGIALQNLARFAGNLLDHGEVVAENLHRDVGARAFEDFVEAHFDGLAEQVAFAGNVLAEFLGHQRRRVRPW